MQKLIIILATGASLLVLGNLLANTSQHVEQRGVALTDEQASAIRGGTCTGVENFDCTGTSCAVKTVLHVCKDDTGSNGTGDSTCGGTGGCGHYYLNPTPCD